VNERVLLELRRDVARENWRIPWQSLLFSSLFLSKRRREEDLSLAERRGP